MKAFIFDLSSPVPLGVGIRSRVLALGTALVLSLSGREVHHFFAAPASRVVPVVFFGSWAFRGSPEKDEHRRPRL